MPLTCSTPTCPGAYLAVTRSVPAMWECCRDEAGPVGDVDRLAAEVGRLRHDFEAITEGTSEAASGAARAAQEFDDEFEDARDVAPAA